MTQAPTAPQQRSKGGEGRLQGVDSLRFWLALWVYFSHFGLLPFAVWIGKSTTLRLTLTGLSNNLFNGAAAVIGFFLISGLCIHYPYRNVDRVPTLQFYTRRYLRISIPLMAALVCAYAAGNDLIGFYEGIIWSLIAELIYYALYPLLWRLWRRFGWKPVLFTSYAIALVIILSNLRAMNFHDFGPRLTWAVGLPSWLLGCYLAETCGTTAPVSMARIWRWRFLVWGLSCVSMMLRTHGGVGYPITLTILGPFIYVWLRVELAGHRVRRAVPAIEYAGKFSYSIYLIHGMAVGLLGVMSVFLVGDSVVAYGLRLIWVIAASYVFYLLVERPSHRFARWSARRIRS